MVTDPQTACFEASTKFGTLYHQFVGTPVSPDNTRNLERTMAEAIKDQPHYELVSIHILDDALDAELAGLTADYTELTGRFMEVEVEIDYKGVHVRARMEMEDGYPLMKIVSVE